MRATGPIGILGTQLPDGSQHGVKVDPWSIRDEAETPRAAPQRVVPTGVTRREFRAAMRRLAKLERKLADGRLTEAEFRVKLEER